MTEVPEHLLRRSRERKAAAAGGAEPGVEAGAAATDATAKGDAVEPAAAAAPAAAAGGGRAPATPAYTGPPQPPPRRPRIPLWALPVVGALPFWAMLYAGAFGEEPVVATGIYAEGAAVYRGAGGCGGCHGPTGGGGTGPALSGVLETFPNFADHVAWVTNGSSGVKGQPYGATGRIASGNMPGFGNELSADQIVAVVCHERRQYGGAEEIPECVDEAEAGEGGGETADSEGVTPGGEAGG